MLLQTILNPQDPFWHASPNVSCPATPLIPLSLKQELIHSHLLVLRSSEETVMIEKEMSCVLTYVTNRMDALKQRIQELREGEQSKLTKGATAVLRKQYMQTELHLTRALPFFEGIIPFLSESRVHIKHMTKSSEFEDDSESDDDSLADEEDYDF